MSQPILLSPSDFVAITNQILDNAFGTVQIEGELSNFRISKNKWLYFDLKDEVAKVACFGSVYILPGPLKDGMLVRVYGVPRLNPQFGFNVNVQSIIPTGEGSIKKALELLKNKLTKEGMFEQNRKRLLPEIPKNISLITSKGSAAHADFIKIINHRWPFLSIKLYDVQVQGEKSAEMIVEAISYANKQSDLTEVLVITRGGGSIDDLAVFNDERVVRAVAASRIPTLIAIGHEIDESLSELAADKRASTPSNAAELLVPDKKQESLHLLQIDLHAKSILKNLIKTEINEICVLSNKCTEAMDKMINDTQKDIFAINQVLVAYNPANILARGYAIVAKGCLVIKNSKQLMVEDIVNIKFAKGSVNAKIRSIK